MKRREFGLGLLFAATFESGARADGRPVGEGNRAFASTEIGAAPQGGPIILGDEPARVDLRVFARAKEILARAGPGRRLVLVVSGIHAPRDVSGAYDVFCEFGGAAEPIYIGTLPIFDGDLVKPGKTSVFELTAIGELGLAPDQIITIKFQPDLATHPSAKIAIDRLSLRVLSSDPRP